jgi:hypothetical protein
MCVGRVVQPCYVKFNTFLFSFIGVICVFCGESPV